jgi:hypothetical protein
MLDPLFPQRYFRKLRINHEIVTLSDWFTNKVRLSIMVYEPT